MFRTDESLATESRSVVAYNWGRETKKGVIEEWLFIFWLDDLNVLKLMVLMRVQF